MVDQPATIGALPVAVARDLGHQVAYLPGLAMRRIADRYPGRAKTDARDAFVIAKAHAPRISDKLVETIMTALGRADRHRPGHCGRGQHPPTKSREEPVRRLTCPHLSAAVDSLRPVRNLQILVGLLR